MTVKQEHSFHLVDPSPLPILSSFAIMLLLVGAVMQFGDVFGGAFTMYFGLTGMIICAYKWWASVVRESAVDKAHTLAVQDGLRLGVLVFILSEAAFFFAFFYGYFTNALIPVDVLDGGAWPVSDGVFPPAGIETFDPFGIPLLNTLILLLSGTTVTWAHYAVLKGDKNGLQQGLAWSVVLGVVFSILQFYEYHHAKFAIDDGMYAANFYLATGFHGVHVILGTIFLGICYVRARRGQFSNENHVGFTAAAWYWHFVDIVWILLYISVYILGR